MANQHPFARPTASDARAPCPALNTLANHGYLPRNGRDITFIQLLFTVQHVYNLSLLLAFVLTAVGFATSARFTWSGFLPNITLTLSDLSAHGLHKIAHDASLVHPNGVESSYPDPTLVAHLIHSSSIDERDGISLTGMAKIHERQVDRLGHPLDRFHEQVALGECGLAWAVLRRRDAGRGEEERDVIPTTTVRQWFGEERLPDNWWEEVRPRTAVTLWEAQSRADSVGRCGCN